MFWHNYIYRLKCIVRDKEVMFWTLLFPIIMATLFNLAFSNIGKSERFSNIKVAIVEDENLEKNKDLVNIMEEATSSDDGKNINLFDIEYVKSKEEADDLLINNDIEGYISFDNDINLYVNKLDINQNIIKEFLDSYKQGSSLIKNLIMRDPNLLNEGIISETSTSKEYIKDVPVSSSNPDNVIVYFYSLIAMSCLLGGFFGIKEISALQANIAPQGVRVSLTSANKLKMFTSSILAATTVQLIDIYILIGYLAFVLKIGFGNDIGYILLTCAISALTGVSFGTCISSMIKKGEGIKIAIIIASSNLMCFLSGMMYDKMKYIVNQKFPILSYINPANLISDSFYAIYYYDTKEQLFLNLTLLSLMTSVFIAITYLILRRQRYDSI